MNVCTQPSPGLAPRISYTIPSKYLGNTRWRHGVGPYPFNIEHAPPLVRRVNGYSESRVYPPHKALSLCPLFSSLPRTTITATPSLYTPHEIVVPGQVRLGPGARIEDQKYIQCVVDTGCIPCHGLFARGLFDRLRPSDQYIRVADPAPNPLRLVGAGDSILGGGDWGVYVTLQVPIIAQDGRWEVAECVDVFLYEADTAGLDH